MDYRIEKDTIGEVKVLKHVLWGPQTQRSINNFKIGLERNSNQQSQSKFASRHEAISRCELW